MNNRLRTVALALTGIIGLGTGVAHAAPYLTPTGGPGDNNYVQLLEDGAYEVLLNPSPNFDVKPIDQGTIIQVGDYFAGVQRVQATELAAPEGGPPPEPISLQGNTETFTSIFLLEGIAMVGDGIFGNNSADAQYYGPAGTEAWETVFGAAGVLDISDSFSITNLDGSGARVNPGTMAMLFNGAIYSSTDSTGPLPSSASTFVDNAALQYEFGFNGALGSDPTAPTSLGEFWQTTGLDSEFPFYTSTSTPNVKLALNMTRQWAGPDLEAHIYRQTLGDINFVAPTQLQGEGSVAGVAAGTNWGVFADLDLYIRPESVPAPSPLTLLALGLVGLGIARRWMASA